VPQPRPSPRGPDLTFSGAELSVRQMIANGKAKVALDRAKDIHKAHASPASEALLLDAYVARIQALIQQDLVVEANSLMDLLRERYPSAASRLAALVTTAAARSGKLDDLLRSLGDPSLPPEQRALIEQALERNVCDLSVLAGSAALSPDHPLRQAAIALQRAFAAVTTGPVTDDALALPEISRRSPLAPWKMLVRAIAAFYREDKETCRRYLAAIKTDSAPARCILVIEALLDGKAASTLKGSAAELVSRVTGNATALKHAVEKLDSAFNNGEPRPILKAVRPAVDECRRTMPESLERFKQHIAVRCALVNISEEQVLSALGGPARRDAYFYRLFASGSEHSGDPGDDILACSIWDLFRQLAIDEGWFPSNGPEVAILYLHMAKLIEKVPSGLIRSFEQSARKKSELGAEELYYLSPEKLYQRASLADPNFETLQQWLGWAKTQGAMHSDPVAEAWHKMRPGDLDPVLHLMESYASRNAYPTALQYLDKAENIDGVSTEVRRARMRLMSRSVIRYIQQKKPELAFKRLDEIAALPQSQQGDRPAFLAALRYVAATVNRDPERLRSIRAEVEQRLESSAAAALLIFATGVLCKCAEPMLEIRKISKEDRMGLPATFARLMVLSKDMQFDMEMPPSWMREIAAQFGKSKQPLSVVQLRELGRGGLSARQPELAYKASAKGLEAGDATQAEFLLLRAKALPPGQVERRMVCAAAAAELARQHGDVDLAGKAVELLAGPFKDGSIKVTLQQAAEVVRAEIKKPKPKDPPPSYRSITAGEFCDCLECQRARGQGLVPFYLDDDDDLDDDPFDEDDPMGFDMPPDMPPAIAAMLFEETEKAVMKGESLDDLMARLIDMGFPPPPGYRRQSKKARRG
jgi:tetratricopeptide (TPR) repeat protein